MRRLLFRRWSRSARTLLTAAHPWRWLSAAAALLVLFCVGTYTHARGIYPANTRAGWPVFPRNAYTLWRKDFATSTRSFILAGVLVFMLYAFRRFLLARLVRRPGPIEVAELEDATPKKDLLMPDLTIRFRAALARVNLSSTAAVPGAGPPAAFLELLTTAGSAKNPIASIAGLLRVTSVSHAFRVSAVFRVRDGLEPCGITVLVAILPKGGTPPITVWGRDWPQAVGRAADAVGAAILPLTRLCKKPPWRGWRGLELPAELFTDYLEAKTLAANHRYDEALGKYYDALARDPKNLYIRLEVGRLQEQLRLFLDAMETYDDIIALATRGDERLGRPFADLWARLRRRPKTVDDKGVASRPGRRRQAGLQPAAWPIRATNVQRVVLFARYRYALLLGFSEVFLAQWIKSVGGDEGDAADPQAAGNAARLTRRDQERFRIRSRLLPRLSLYEKHSGAPVLDVVTPPDVIVAAGIEPATAGPRRPFAPTPQQVLDARELLQKAAWEELHQLYRDYRLWTGRRRLHISVTSRALRLSDIWAELRLERVQWLISLDPSREPLPWPPPFEDVHTEVHQVLKRRPLFGYEWQDFYNAACAYAIVLLPDDRLAGQPTSRPTTDLGSEVPDRFDLNTQQYAEATVRCLERAMDASDSSFAAARRSWLESEDPDMAGFRTRQEYSQFWSRNFPIAQRPTPQPLNVHALQLTSYVTDLLRGIAAAELRSLKQGVTPGPVDGWFERDRRSWETVLRVALDHRDWRVRLAGLHHVRRSAADEDVIGIGVYPSYPEPWIRDLQAFSDPNDVRFLTDAAANARQERVEQIDRLAGMLQSHVAFLVETEPLEDVWTDRLRKRRDASARLWELFHQCLAMDFFTNDTQALERLRDTAGRAERRFAAEVDSARSGRVIDVDKPQSDDAARRLVPEQGTSVRPPPRRGRSA